MIVTPDLSLVLDYVTTQKGSVVCYPTETFYALGAVYDDAKALERICKIKSRARDKGFILLVSDLVMAESIAYMDEMKSTLVSRFWPGPLTVILKAKEGLDPMVAPGGRVALRVSSHPLAFELVNGLGPITSTSANISGMSPAVALKDILEAHLDVDAILDGGKTAGGAPSTIVDLTNWPPVCVRQGAIPFDMVKDAL